VEGKDKERCDEWVGRARGSKVRERAGQRDESEQVRVCGVPRGSCAAVHISRETCGMYVVPLSQFLCFLGESFLKIEQPCCLSVLRDIFL